MKTAIVFLLFTTTAALVAPLGCKDVSCDPTLTRPIPNDPDGKVAHLEVGDDGLCRWPWYKEANWGSKCESTEDCGAGLICLAPDLPICSRINCNPDPRKDTVCGLGFMCLETGDDVPTVCIPDPTANNGGGGSGNTGGGAGGAGPTEGGAPTDGGASATEEPNIGTACTMADDPVCKGGTFCEHQQLKLCTVAGCVEAGPAKDACDAAAADGFTCFSSPPAPPDGVCVKF